MCFFFLNFIVAEWVNFVPRRVNWTISKNCSFLFSTCILFQIHYNVLKQVEPSSKFAWFLVWSNHCRGNGIPSRLHSHTLLFDEDACKGNKGTMHTLCMKNTHSMVKRGLYIYITWTTQLLNYHIGFAPERLIHMTRSVNSPMLSFTVIKKVFSEPASKKVLMGSNRAWQLLLPRVPFR